MTHTFDLEDTLVTYQQLTVANNDALQHMSYALYKFHKAILSLDGTYLQKKEWLASCYIVHILHLRQEDIPQCVEDDIRQLKSDLTMVPGIGIVGTLEATVSQMENAEADKIIHRIFHIYKILRGSEIVEKGTEIKQSVSKPIPNYDPDRLLDALIGKLSLKNDAALSRALEVSPPIISKIRSRRVPIGASLLIRMHEISELSIKDLRSLLGDRRNKFRLSEKPLKLESQLYSTTLQC